MLLRNNPSDQHLKRFSCHIFLLACNIHLKVFFATTLILAPLSLFSCSSDLSAPVHKQVNAFLPFCSPPSHGHYHIHAARHCPLLPFLSVHWPLGLPSSHAGHLCLHLFVSEELFWLQCPMDEWKQGTLELPQKWSLKTTSELNLTWLYLCLFVSTSPLCIFSVSLIHSQLRHNAPFWQKSVPTLDCSAESDSWLSC